LQRPTPRRTPEAAGGLVRRRGGRLRRRPWILLALLAVWCSCSVGEGDRKPSGKSRDYRAAIAAEVQGVRAAAGETSEIALRIKNIGRREWRSAGGNPCLVSYHLLDTRRNILRFDNPRTPLPGVVGPGRTVEVAVRVKAPLEQGDYRLEFDLVREGVAWFKDGGGATLELPLASEEVVWPEDEVTPDLAYGRCTTFRTSLPECEALRRLIRLTLRHDEVQFAGKTGRVTGFAAGAGYPQIWLRDSATIIPASRFYYPEAYLTSWIEEHLVRQKPDGALEDWVGADGRSDKNTVETDQEASAVQAAYQAFLLKGGRAREWLLKPVAGEAVIDRLNKALRFPFSERFSKRFGLLTGAHTADWGDVDPEDADQKAIYVDERTHWTADIYDQAMAFEACRDMAEMFRFLGKMDTADFWEKTAAELKSEANRRLWQDDKGFYRIHIHLTPWLHAFDEDEIYAMGGNAQAVISGLADRRQAERIIEEALARQRRLGVSTISGSLLPPYPPGFFKHPALDETYEYQNGGQWDWFGGRLILAMFENGFAREALASLLEVVKKDLANEGLFEWDTKDGAGRGSDFYAGSAGSLARALFEGYLGFRLAAGGLSLEPMLGEAGARAHFYLPAADIFAAYIYEPVPAERKITLRYNSNDSRPGAVKVLIPWAFFGLKGAPADRTKIEVLRDGEKVPFTWSSVRRDDSIVVKTDFRDHRLEIKVAAK
jgi:hypothetical protein